MNKLNFLRHQQSITATREQMETLKQTLKDIDNLSFYVENAYAHLREKITFSIDGADGVGDWT